MNSFCQPPVLDFTSQEQHTFEITDQGPTATDNLNRVIPSWLARSLASKPRYQTILFGATDTSCLPLSLIPPTSSPGPLSLTMLYNWRSHYSSALFILLTSTKTRALYIPRSTIITTTTTTTTSKTSFVWSNQNQQFDPSNEDTATLPFICFTCPMNSKLLREVRLFTPAVGIAVPSNDPEPRALLCEYDTNESTCRYDPVCRLSLSRFSF